MTSRRAHPDELVQLSFSPLRTDDFAIAQTSAAPYPQNVPSRDRALLLKPLGNATAIV